MKKLHILQTPVRFNPYIGGVENHVYYLSKELIKLGHDASVICANEPKDKRLSIEGIKVKRLNYLLKITNTNITLGFPWSLLNTKFDIIHTHMPTPWSADISILMGKLMKKKSVITIHNDIDKTSFLSKIITEIYLHTIFLLSLSIVDRIIIVNEEWEKSFLNTGSILKRYKNKISTLPNGVNNEFFKPLNIQKQKDSVLFVSILDKHHKFKGLDYLLEAIKLVKESIPDVKLIIIGEGKLRTKYEDLSKKLGISENVNFLGGKKQKDLIKLYNMASVFILPSTEIEGFGIVAIEAMACKTPVIATDIVGVAKEIKRNNCGIIVKPKNSSSLAEAIVMILKNPKSAGRMGGNGRRLVEEKYDWQRITKNIENIYKEITK
ncbi:glycosyltransferase family 1 protein [Candidatus Microgenomates bacterium]|nr:MAG: glycosyltransferase family 1 protein [Candidatus Microgenomates bacterium]